MFNNNRYGVGSSVAQFIMLCVENIQIFKKAKLENL